MWTVHFNNDVDKEINRLPLGIRTKMYYIFELLEDYGNQVRESHVKSLGEWLFEIRAKGEEGIARAFFTFKKGKIIIVFHSFIKKSQKTPKNELEKARSILKQMKDQE